MLLGCIGDDFTGSSDLANTLAKGGMSVTQYCGVPTAPAEAGVEAGVVALKTRSVPVDEAVAESLAAFRWLAAQGCRQFFFKYCSTFDSTPEGNIGPVADALIEELDARQVVVCPAFPATGRTLYMGHLFVGDRLLNESGLEDHPLTPMTDPDIRRWLSHQTRHTVGIVPYGIVAKGAEAVGEALTAEDAVGHRLIVVDAVTDADLMTIGEAARDLPLITGGSGVALGLPENFRSAGLISDRGTNWQGLDGPAAILSGSCSRATRRQIEIHTRTHPALALTADAIMTGQRDVNDVADWVMQHADDSPLVYSSADPHIVRVAQETYGREPLAAAIEGFFATLAGRLADAGIRRLVSAGGESSGAVVRGLGCTALEIGPEIDPGVPALKVEGRDLVLALKSGNFGGDDFFAKALATLRGRAA